MELIDRDLVSAVISYEYDFVRDGQTDIKTISEFHDSVQDIISKQPTVNTWISVEERYSLPKCKGEKHSVEIIARDKYGNCRNCVYWGDGYDCFETEDGTILDDIVAYMPIPEYKESKNGRKRM